MSPKAIINCICFLFVYIIFITKLLNEACVANIENVRDCSVEQSLSCPLQEKLYIPTR